jgi:hypothetical protein
MLTTRCRTVNWSLDLSQYGCLPAVVFAELSADRGLVTVQPHKKFSCLAQWDQKYHSESPRSKMNKADSFGWSYRVDAGCIADDSELLPVFTVRIQSLFMFCLSLKMKTVRISETSAVYHIRVRYITLKHMVRIWYSGFGIVTNLRIGDSGVQFPAPVGIRLLATTSLPALGLFSFLFSEYRRFIPRQ